MEYNTNKNNVLDNKTGFLPEESITSSNSSQTKTELNHALAEKMIHLQKRKSTVVYFNALFYCAVFFAKLYARCVCGKCVLLSQYQCMCEMSLLFCDAYK